jgi:hypothetical protein
MRFLYLLILCCCVQACEGYDYYFAVEDGHEVTNSVLYKDEQLTISFQIYNGNVSRLNFSTSKKNSELKVEVLKYDHSLIADKNIYSPSLIGDHSLGVINFPENGWATITSKYALDKKPESLIESVEVEMLIDGNLKKLAKKFHLTRGSYSRFDALMD